MSCNAPTWLRVSQACYQNHYHPDTETEEHMFIVFCSNPLNPREIDEDYTVEMSAAENAGMDHGIFSFEELVYNQNPQRAVARIPEQPEERAAVYRGWMLTPGQYGQLYSALLSKGVRLLTSPAQYQFCHWLPEWYPAAAKMTPESTWIPSDTPDFQEAIREKLLHFGSKPIVIKDYVKSQKHKWVEACFIPNAANTEQALEVIQRFLDLQGEDIQGGLVMREFVELAYLANHSKSDMPLSIEYRAFFLGNEPLQVVPYWEEGEYREESPDLSGFKKVIEKIPSPFFTVDLAKRREGGWIIMEIGDGQVSGLPEHSDIDSFYCRLATCNK